MRFDRPTFFKFVRRAPFGNRLSQSQVDGMEHILSVWERRYNSFDVRFLAYILATAFHETGGQMVPVREGFAKSDRSARAIVAKYKYGKPDPHTGEVYYGRGLVQLTWAENYQKMGDLLDLNLYTQPDLALDPNTSVEILIEGMIHGKSGRGDFTGKSLENYFNESVDDPEGARRIINGTDKASLIATYHKAFLDSLQAAERSDTAEALGLVGPQQKEVAVDGPNLLKDKTMLGLMTAGGGGVVSTLLGSIQNPYALAGFAIIAIGLFLVFTGRIEIKRKAGA